MMKFRPYIVTECIGRLLLLCCAYRLLCMHQPCFSIFTRGDFSGKSVGGAVGDADSHAESHEGAPLRSKRLHCRLYMYRLRMQRHNTTEHLHMRVERRRASSPATRVCPIDRIVPASDVWQLAHVSLLVASDSCTWLLPSVQSLQQRKCAHPVRANQPRGSVTTHGNLRRFTGAGETETL